MTISADTVSLLIDAGLGGETLKNILAAIERDVTVWNTVRNSDAGSVSPAALRMREKRAKERLLKEELAANSVNIVPEQFGTTDNILSLEVKGCEERKKEDTRERNKYPELFEKFWKAYPTDGGMSKKEAFKPWQKMTGPERELAIAAIPAFKRWAEKQGDSYRVVHACRYLSQGRFEGFSDQAAKMAERASAVVYVKYGTDAGDAWELHYKTVRNKIAPRDQNGGWYFPSEFPPTQSEAA